MSTEYDDIINLPHHVSKRHPKMSLLARAAQFAPFSALTGYGTEIKKSAQRVGECFEEQTAENFEDESPLLHIP